MGTVIAINRYHGLVPRRRTEGRIGVRMGRLIDDDLPIPIKGLRIRRWSGEHQRLTSPTFHVNYLRHIVWSDSDLTLVNTGGHLIFSPGRPIIHMVVTGVGSLVVCQVSSVL